MELETMSHVDLLDDYDGRVGIGLFDDETSAVRAEILRRMDSACTSRREEIEPNSADHQR